MKTIFWIIYLSCMVCFSTQPNSLETGLFIFFWCALTLFVALSAKFFLLYSVVLLTLIASFISDSHLIQELQGPSFCYFVILTIFLIRIIWDRYNTFNGPWGEEIKKNSLSLNDELDHDLKAFVGKSFLN